MPKRVQMPLYTRGCRCLGIQEATVYHNYQSIMTHSNVRLGNRLVPRPILIRIFDIVLLQQTILYTSLRSLPISQQSLSLLALLAY